MKKHVAFAFGRFNPPTVGHKKLIDTVVDASDGGDFYIFTSQSQDPDKNPLDYQTKVNFLKKLFPDIQDKIIYDVSIKNVLQANYDFLRLPRTSEDLLGPPRTS